MKAIMRQEIIEQNIFLIRGHKVMLSTHLAELYKVKVRSLVQAVKRNIGRFPEDFMFQLTWKEAVSLKSQIVISKGVKEGGSRSQDVTLKRKPVEAWLQPDNREMYEKRTGYSRQLRSCV